MKHYNYLQLAAAAAFLVSSYSVTLLADETEKNVQDSTIKTSALPEDTVDVENENPGTSETVSGEKPDSSEAGTSLKADSIEEKKSIVVSEGEEGTLTVEKTEPVPPVKDTADEDKPAAVGDADNSLVIDSSGSSDSENLIISDEDEEGLIIDSEEEDIFEIEEEITAPSGLIENENQDDKAGNESDSISMERDKSRYSRYRERYRERDAGVEEPDMKSGGRSDDVASDTTVEDSVPMGPAEIKEVRSINFAKSLEGYRSPKRAMLLSLLLPGLGQAYSKKYAKTVIFGTVEAALVGFAIKFSVDGRNRKDDAHDFADRHYSQQRFQNYYNNLKVLLENRQGEDLADPDSVLDDIYYDDIEKSYDKIQQKPFVQGWDDCEPRLESDGVFDFDGVSSKYQYDNINDDSAYLLIQIDTVSGDTTDYIYGYSDRQKKYNNDVSIADKQFRIATGFLFAVLVNHVVSAVDALFSARQHNLELLGRETFLDRFDILHSVAFDDGGLKSYYGVRIRF